jgi:hypothetical protein
MNNKLDVNIEKSDRLVIITILNMTFTFFFFFFSVFPLAVFFLLYIIPDGLK